VVSVIAVDKSSSSGLLHCIIEIIIPDVLKNCNAFIFGVQESKKKCILVLFDPERKVTVIVWNVRSHNPVMQRIIPRDADVLLKGLVT
jgi:hypothetical protein